MTGNETMIKGVLFDLDGVLIDTEGTYTKFWEAVDERFPTGVQDFAQVIKGSNLDNILYTYFPTEELREQVTMLLDELQGDMHYDYFPGAIELLEQLERAGIACCLVTSSDSRKMEALCRQHTDFASHFEGIVTGNMVSEPKPSPECFVLGAKKLGLDIEQCVVIEDSINGLLAGMRSGARVIGLCTTCSREAIATHCHMVAASVSELSVDIISGL